MGQKIHPIGFRIGIIRGWDSRWYQDKNYAEWLHEDMKVRQFVEKRHRTAGITRVEIERANKVHVIINTAKPGLVIGKRGVGIEDLRKGLEKLTGKPIKISVQEIKQHEFEAGLVAENIAEALVKRVAFRRAMKQAAQRVMKAGAKGVRIQVSGRLGGHEIARSERTFQGKVPLHTLRADVDYAIRTAETTYGVIGVKVWVYRGDILPERVAQAQPTAAGIADR
ncbi:MAG: 30S ribosomal protein S3 [Burkholderiales bacterium]|jgi:small subunit ribosomal protein S3|nr:30S ribosomal protein S3 [Burkholderiales bacterium]